MYRNQLLLISGILVQVKLLHVTGYYTGVELVEAFLHGLCFFCFFLIKKQGLAHSFSSLVQDRCSCYVQFCFKAWRFLLDHQKFDKFWAWHLKFFRLCVRFDMGKGAKGISIQSLAEKCRLCHVKTGLPVQ